MAEFTHEINLEELEFLLPHRPPMRWIDSILEIFERGEGGRTQTIASAGRPFVRGGFVTESSLIELIGQSYGFLKALDADRNGRRVKVAYLAAIDEFDLLSRELPRAGATLLTHVRSWSENPPFYFVEGQVSVQSGGIEIPVCKARVKCFAITEERRDG